MRAVLERGAQVRIDYAAVVDPATLVAIENVDGRALLAVAAFVGQTRLIDNLVLEVRGAEVRDTTLLGSSHEPHPGGNR
jgi:pantothenate synthetase